MMKIIMSLIVATLLLLTSTIAIALEPARQKFEKDEYGLLKAQDRRTFNELYVYVKEKGYIDLSFNVRRHGETRSDDQMERIEQGRRYAQTKRAILIDLEQEIVIVTSDLSPTRPDAFVTVTPAGLLKILNDPRVSSFIVYRRAAYQLGAAQTTDSIVTDLGVDTASAHGDDGSPLTVVIIDSGFDIPKMVDPGKVDDSKSFCSSQEAFNLELGISRTSICPLDSQGNPQNTAVGPGTAKLDPIPTSNETIKRAKYHGRLNAELLQKSAPGVNVILIKVGHIDNSVASCQAINKPAPCYAITPQELEVAFDRVLELINSGQQIDAVSVSILDNIAHETHTDCIATILPSFEDTLQDIRESGARIFAPTGNDGAGQNGVTEGTSHPACSLAVQAVGAVTDSNGALAPYSSFDSDIKTLYGIGAKDLTGEKITATFDEFELEFVGTSFAVPTVVGQFLTLLSRDPTIPPDQILNILNNTGSTVGNNALHKFPTFNKAYDAIDNIPTNTPTTEDPPEFILCSGPYNTPSFLITWFGNSQLPLVGVEFQKSANGSTWTTYNESLAACVQFSGNNYYHRTRFETFFGYSNWSNVVFAYHNCSGGGGPPK